MQSLVKVHNSVWNIYKAWCDKANNSQYSAKSAYNAHIHMGVKYLVLKTQYEIGSVRGIQICLCKWKVKPYILYTEKLNIESNKIGRKVTKS
jgi:hypothetical protein